MTTTPTWTLGDRLRKARDLAGLTQADIASALTTRGFKASRQAVANWEQDTAQPRRLMAVIEAWAELTDVPEVWLLSGVSPGQGQNQNWKFLNGSAETVTEPGSRLVTAA